jgi:hypothetical protein
MDSAQTGIPEHFPLFSSGKGFGSLSKQIGFWMITGNQIWDEFGSREL